MNLFEHQIFGNRQPEALEEENKKGKKGLMKYLAMNFSLPNPPNQSSIKRIYGKTSHHCMFSSSHLFLGSEEPV